jgi:phosphoribosylformimino-5-aminoimidazole carboxamide ribotide isomerase
MPMKFRPCIDLHQGQVKQIVGSTLSDSDGTTPLTNFTSSKPSNWYAELYQKDELTGGHIIKLGPDNDEAAIEALSAWKGGLQIGGGITAENAVHWLEAGASDIIVTSYVFEKGRIHEDRLRKLTDLVGKDNLVLDLSCRIKNGHYYIVTDRWQNFTSVKIDKTNLDYFSRYCHEFLIHAVDVEGKAHGIEADLVDILGGWGKIPVTYAGGIHSIEDIELIRTRGNENLDFTVGSALDIFGGHQLVYEDLVCRYHTES